MISDKNNRSIGNKINRLWCALGAVALLAFLGAGVAQAQVPEDIETQLLKIGHVVDPPCTAKLYRQMMPPKDFVDQLVEMQQTGKPSSAVPIYPGVTVWRDVAFDSANPKDVVDIYAADKGPASRPVLMFVPGGAGEKVLIQTKETNAFNDNIPRWAAENGMIGVIMERHAAVVTPNDAPDFYSGGKDVSSMIQWVEKNIATYKGNSDRMFIWAQSAGNGPLGVYTGHPELYGPKGIGVKGIIFMSGQFSILRPDGANPSPLPQPGAGGAGGGGGRGGAAGGGGANPPAGGAGSTCGITNGATDGLIPGRAPGQPGGPNIATNGGGRGAAAQVSQEELIKRSSLPALEKTDAKILLASAGLDPGVDGNLSPFNRALHDELCKLDGPNAKDGVGHCPKMLFELGESHMSEVFSVDTPDTTVSGPILAWIQSIK